MSAGVSSYFQLLRDLLDTVERAEAGNIERAADLMATAISSGHRVVLFGTGHSNGLALEFVDRAGGLVAPEAIRDSVLSMLEGLEKSTAAERLGDYGPMLVDQAGLSAGDVLLVISNSGRNAVPVQALQAAAERGVHTIALTSLAHSGSMPPRAPATARMFEVAEVVLDNHGVAGDAAIEVPGAPHPLGSTSTVVGAAIMQALSVRTAERLVELGTIPEVYLSSNVTAPRG